MWRRPRGCRAPAEWTTAPLAGTALWRRAFRRLAWPDARPAALRFEWTSTFSWEASSSLASWSRGRGPRAAAAERADTSSVHWRGLRCRCDPYRCISCEATVGLRRERDQSVCAAASSAARCGASSLAGSPARAPRVCQPVQTGPGRPAQNRFPGPRAMTCGGVSETQWSATCATGRHRPQTPSGRARGVIAQSCMPPRTTSARDASIATAAAPGSTASCACSRSTRPRACLALAS
mmetsp:Transcript_67333/g.208301  ORF Transcript_67333/g.208301 Transcript_67333/m.208301 type:complete len:236 (+) Transcript_67333:50-757(+)